MDLTPHTSGVTQVDAKQFRSYAAAANEQEFVLVDVRQPEEYTAEHIPGAVLIPLMELEARAGELRKLTQGKKAVFVCRSGGRSGRASEYAARVLNLANVFNLSGGMLGWNGIVLNASPNLKPFAATGTLRDALMVALSLEKASDVFYAQLSALLADTTAAETINALTRMESNHARSLFDTLKASSPDPVPSFEELMASLPGELLESGESLQAALARAKSAVGGGPAALLETALEIELRAQDLYRNLAARADREDLRRAFLDLAEQEKHHANAVLKALAQLPRA